MTIKLKRGLKAGLPLLQQGEPAFTTDTKELFIGDGTDNIRLSSTIIETTYDALKALRDASKLVPGQQYRITDYITTTVQADTQSAEHQFDIIVTADSVNKLNENVRACHHDFSGPVTNLDDLKTNHTYEVEITTNASKLLELQSIITNVNYNLAIAIKKNETEKYIGFNTSNEPYNSIEELLYTATYKTDLNTNDADNFEVKQFTYDNEYEINIGTYNIFDYLTITDITGNYFANSKLESWKLKYCLDNDTARFAWADSDNGKGVIYHLIDEFNNDVPYDFKNIQFTKAGVWYYTFVDDLVGNSHNNKIGVYISGNRATLNANTFGTYCYSNTFGTNCYSNTFGTYCYSNTFGTSCFSNTFGDNCRYNTFGTSCFFITFGDFCASNTFDTNCSSNTFGNSCSYNTFGNYCRYNTFGNYCQYNTFGNDCRYLQISDISTTSKNYIHVENGTRGASSANKFDLYDTAILNKSYQVTFKKSASGKYLMLWSTDTGAMTGKVKDSNTDTTWADIV